jgi:CBS domain-containing membrane protein
MKIRDCMKRHVVSIPAVTTLGEAAAIFVERHVGLLPVLDGGSKPIGVLGLRDLLKLTLPSFINIVEDIDFVHDFGAVENARPAPEVLAQPVSQFMSPVTTVTEDSGLLRAYALMLQHRLHDLPVVNAEGQLVGIASRVDLGTAILRSWKKEA